MPTKPTVHVIDDDEAMRDSLAFLLEAHGFETRLYEEPAAFLAILAEPPTGCVLTDVRMPNMTGLELVRELKARGCGLPVVVMTGHGDIALAVEAMKAGVADFIEKPFTEAAVVDALKEALAGQAAPAAGGGEDEAGAEARRRLSTLSPRERDVLQGVVAGKANKVIAYELAISPRTVEIYRANLMTKAGAKNISELMRIALAAGL